MDEQVNQLNKSETSVVLASETKPKMTWCSLCIILNGWNLIIFFNKISQFLCFLFTRRPDDWTLSAGGSGTIYGWGHNHRGQLGGIEGAKVKVPTPTEALATLRPVQLIGGEQTLFAVTADGKVRLFTF